MRQIRTLSLALGFLALVALPVSGQDITGTWLLAVDLGPGGGAALPMSQIANRLQGHMLTARIPTVL